MHCGSEACQRYPYGRSDWIVISILDRSHDIPAIAKILSTGRVPALRHNKSTHGESIAWVNEMIISDDVKLHDFVTGVIGADIRTRHFVSMGQVHFGM